jgi:hypothetical protein
VYGWWGATGCNIIPRESRITSEQTPNLKEMEREVVGSLAWNGKQGG